jgi:Flp pilus assembly protein TadG
MTLFQRWKQTALHNKALVWTSIIVAFGTSFYAGVAVFQLCMLKESSRQTTDQNNRLIAESKRAADAMENSIRQNQTAIDKAAEANRKAIEASDAQNRKLVDAAIAQGRASLDASIEASRLDQRAWVGVSKIDVLIEHDKSTEISVYFKNTGKTPAIEVHGVLVFEWRPAKTTPDDFDTLNWPTLII